MKSLTSEIIKYSKMLNSKKLSALRSGNISIRFKDGFLITPSGKKYSSLKNKDIVFVSLDGKFDKKNRGQNLGRTHRQMDTHTHTAVFIELLRN